MGQGTLRVNKEGAGRVREAGAGRFRKFRKGQLDPLRAGSARREDPRGPDQRIREAPMGVKDEEAKEKATWIDGLVQGVGWVVIVLMWIGLGSCTVFVLGCRGK